jgi:Receptor family ligand binding region
MMLLFVILCWRFVSGTIGTDGVCNVVAILPFTNYGLDHRSVHWDTTKGNETVVKTNNNVGYSHFATLEMAIRHFNERNSIVVSELTNIDSCNVTMVIVKYIDSQSGGHSAAEHLLPYLLNESVSNNICAIIGPSEEVPLYEVSKIAQTFDIPIVAYGGMSMRLVNSRYHPFTTRTSSDANSMAYAIVDYIVRVHNRTNYIAILYPQQTEDNVQQHQLMARYIQECNITNTLSLSFEAMSNGEQEFISSLEDACREIKLSGYRTIITIFSNPKDELPFLTQSAKNHGLLDGDYFWILTGEATQFSAFQNFSYIEYQNMTNLLTGAAFITALDNPIGKSNNTNNHDDSFHVAWQSQGDDTVTRINQLYPIQVSTNPGYYKGQSNYFQELYPVDGTGYLYDAVMTVGLGACRMTTTATTTAKTTTTTMTRNSRRVSDASIRHNSSMLTSIQHFHGIRDTIFQGTSGIVSFGDDTDLFPGSRVVTGLTYGAYNFDGEFLNETTNNASTREGKDL